MNGVADIVIIGGGVNGLTAAAFLARAGKKVVLCEASNRLGGMPITTSPEKIFGGGHVIYAVDPVVIASLKLSRHGLRFAARDMALVGLRRDGRHIVLTRDGHASARSIAVHSQRDAETYPVFRRTLFELARAMRPLWWHTGSRDALKLSHTHKVLLKTLERTSAAAWLESHFESDALKATLAYDVTEGGMSVLDAGSALMFAWRAAQEMCGLQGSSAVPVNGLQTYMDALAKAATASGVDLRTTARVHRLLLEGGAAAGVELENGDRIAAPLVLSGATRFETICSLVPEAAAGFGETVRQARSEPNVGAAQILFTLHHLPAFGDMHAPHGARYIIGEQVETYVSAHASARSGVVPAEFAIELVFPPVQKMEDAISEQPVAAVQIRPFPFGHDTGRHARQMLSERIASSIDCVIPGFARQVIHAAVTLPDDLTHIEGGGASAHGTRMLASWDSRIQTPIPGLMICGNDGEPVGAMSGRAGRIAAQMALRKDNGISP